MAAEHATSNLVAVTRQVASTLAEGDVTWIRREPVDVDRAIVQHGAYESLPRELGAYVISLPPEPTLPDSVFVEDTAVVVDEIAVMTRPAAARRRAEVRSVESVLTSYRAIGRIVEPATLEGGDVLIQGRSVFVGRSTRTNDEGFQQLSAILTPFGYTARQVEVSGCLHLKTGCTYVGNSALLVHPEWIDVRPMAQYELIPVPAGEDFAANTIRLGGAVIVAASFPQTIAMLEDRGFDVRSLDISELQKLEAGLSCCSVIFHDSSV
jgi:dimethylargininase